MKKIILALFIFCVLTGFTKAQTTVTDYDGNVYNTVVIGNQVWMAENLKTTKYNDGTAIPLVTDNTAWSNLTTPGYCWYNNNEATYKATYGALYNWYTVNTGKLCPTGWHVPEYNNEWETLSSYLGGNSVAGGKMKETGITHWTSPNTGATNESGFTALPGGSRGDDGDFVGIGSHGYWWSSEEILSGPLYRRLTYGSAFFDGGFLYKECGFSVRCVKTYTLYTDSLALVALYNSTNGGSWTNNDYWLTGPVSTWYGITVSGDRVTQIDLNYNNLVGTIPPEIGNLTNLTILELYENQLSGSIPPEIGNLTNLTYLDFYTNSLGGFIPTEIGNLTNLTDLDFGSNQLTGTIPAEIGNLTNLTWLYLENNQLSGSIPSEIGNLTNLIGLDLYDNQFSGFIPTEIGNLTSLQYLLLYDNQLSGSIPTEIGNLTNLIYLYLYGNQLSGSIPTEIGNLTNLTNLWLYSNQLSGAIPPQIGNLTNLTVLYLFSNQLSGPVPSEITNLTSLQIFSINDNQFTGLPNLSTIATLSEINASTNQLTFRDIEPNIGVASNFFYYSNQDSVGEIIDTTVYVETSFTLSVSTGGASSQYQWKKDGTNIGTVSGDSTYIINPVAFSDLGIYTCEIANTAATDLTLYSRPINIFVDYPPLYYDSLALVALYNSTDGANWTDKSNWLTGNVSTWYGITVSGDRVTQINLNNNNLVGTIPPEIGDLSNLTIIYLFNNQLSGSIPTEIGNLTNLEELYLYSNQLSGSIPSEIGNLTNLINNLSLFSNQLSGSIPNEIGNLTNLTGLYLHSNQLSGSIPNEIGNLINLHYLCLDNNQLSGSIPTEIGNLTNLTKLWLYSNQLSGAIPPQIGNLTNLTVLYLFSNQLTGSIPSEIGNLTNLVQLYLQNNQLSGSIPSEIGNLTSLQILYLNNNQFTDLPDLSTIASISEFYIQNNQFTFKDIEPNIGVASTTYTYSPQDSVGEIIDTTVYTGTSFTLSVSTGGASSQYQWKKDGINFGSISIDSTYTFNPVAFSDSGTYTCEITNTVATDLTLYSRPVNVFVDYSPLQQDSLALVALYDSTDGANWTDKTNWLTGPVSTWYGVTVSGEGKVTQIALDTNNLIGTIPPEIGNLSNLTTLSLNYNLLSGTIPPEIGNLSNLTTLRLDYNLLSGTIPTEIGNLSNLTTLRLDFNQLSGSIPTEIGSLTNLTYLRLSSNQLSGSIPSEIGNLSNLTTLRLDFNQLSGSIPAEIGNLSSLQILCLHINQLSGTIPIEIGNLTNLTQLWLWSNPLTGSIPNEIGNLTNLTELMLFQNQLSGSIPTEIGNLSNLNILFLANNQLSGSIPTEIGNLTNLTALGIEVNNFSGPFPPEICNLTNLEELNLGYTQLTGTIPKEIGNLTSLIRLHLNSNQLSDSVPTEIGSLTNLIYINLDDNQFTYLPDLSTLTSLEDLQIQNNKFTFKDIEPNIGVPDSTFIYAPQDSIGEIIDTTIYTETSFTLSVSTGGANSRYQWKKDGTNFGSISSDSTYTFNPVALSDLGIYTCEITNTAATDLTLYSRPQNVTVEVKLCEVISNWEDITPPWQSFDPATFDVVVIENPDKTGINPSDSCAKLTTTADYYEYMWYDLPGAETWNFSTHPVYKLMVNAPTEGNVVLRFENSDNTVGVQRLVYYSNPGSWEELVFDFTGVVRDSLIRMVIYPDYDSPTAGNEWFIDEIIHCDLHLNAGIVELIIPTPGCGLTNNEPITVQITNFGIDAISGFDISYQIDNGTVVTETVISIIDPGDTLTYTFSTKTNLYTTEFYKEYYFSANTMLTGDEGPNNDQYNEIIRVYGNYTDREGWTTYGICDGMAGDGGTTGVVEDGSGNIWVGTDEGVSVYNGVSWITYDTANSPLTSNSIETLYADDLGNVWIGTWKDEGGVCKYDGSTWTTYTTENSGIAGNVVEEIIKDSNGNYWFSTYDGISKFDVNGNWTIYNTVNSGLVDDYTNAITEDSFGNIWIGTSSGVSKYDVSGDTWTTYNTDNSSLEINSIYAISEDLQGNIWFGTYGGGVTKFDGTTWTTYRISNSDFPDDRVLSIMADTYGNVWFGTFGSGAVKYDGTTWIIYNEENGLVTRSYYDGSIFFWGDIFEDSNGNIWFPTYHGLAKKAPVSIEIYNIEYSYSTCNGTNDGTITIYALAENPPLQYSINGGTTFQSDSIFTGLAPGTYPIAVTDGVNTVSTDVVVLMDFDNIASYPYTQNFDSYSVNSTGFDDGWFNESSNNLDWMVYSGSTPSPNTGPVTDQSGSGNYLYLEASAHYFDQGSLISPCFDISGLSNPTLKFYYHMSGTDMGELAVDIYSGGAWINNVMFASGDHGTNWLQYSTDLSPYGSIIKFRFRGIIGDTYLSDIAIDNIEVTGLSKENDILTFSFPQQTGPAIFDYGNHLVDIEVAYGTDVSGLVATFTISDLANITVSTTSQVSGVTSNNFTSPVTYTVTAEDGTTQDWVVTVTVATSLSSENDILSFSFDEQTGAATINNVNHTISIAVTNGTDLTNLVATFTISDLATIDISGTLQISGVTANNFSNPVTYTVTAENDAQQDWVITVTTSTPVIISSFPYQENFETGDGDWYAGGINSSWDYGIPSAGQTINSAASGNNAWVTNLTGDYYPDEVSYIMSPRFDLSGLNYPKIEFSIWWYAEGFYDGANLQYKEGTGEWKTLGTDEGDDSWYNNSYLYSIEKGFGFDINNSAGWSGDDEWGYGSNGWVTVDHALTGIDYQSANVSFRIGFASNSGYENDGIAIDDINIYDDPTGINETNVLLSDIQIYPNPNEGTFTLVYNGERDVDLILQLINIRGQVVLTEQIKTGYRFSKEFELDYLPAGLYYFRLKHKEGVVVKKMVVK